MTPSILIVEDEPEVRSLVEYTLAKEKYKVQTAENGKQALEILDQMTPDLITLDLMLPDLHGLEICKKLRSDPRFQSVSVLMLTALDSLDDIVRGFETGADDYLVKPFQLPELVARVKALLRRRHVGRSERMVASAGGMIVDLAHHRATMHDRVMDALTYKEMELLFVLLRRSPKVVRRSYLLQRLWGRQDSRALDVHILHLRQKLGPKGGEQILTVPGQGYKFVPMLFSEESNIATPPAAKNPTIPPPQVHAA
jgi:two-component system alkaline phosphatase synthesis response regulator PhoP